MSYNETLPAQAEQQPEDVSQHAWEDSKENFQPARDGRKPSLLLDIKSKEERAVLQPKGIEADRERFVEAIEGYTGDDPLEKWLDYIKWTKNTFVSGGKTSELLPLLEKCTREFHESIQYKDDIRYLRVWIMYADCLPDPSDVFSYMIDHMIGQGHALFYIAYATFCELTRNYALADSMYQKGIQAKAAPLDRLETKFLEFQHRMVRRIERQAPGNGQQGQHVANANERRGLKTIRGPLGGRPVDKRRNMASNAGSNSIPVFEDDQFSSSSVQPPPRGRMVLPPGHAESQKENVQAAKPWMGQTIKQQNSHISRGPHVSLDVMEDPEFAVSGVGSGDIFDGVGRAQVKAGGGKASLRQRFDRDGVEEQLSSDPLLLLKCPPRKTVPKLPAAGLKSRVEDGIRLDAQVKGEDFKQKHEISPFDQDVTMATSDAYKAMNCLFTGETSEEPVNKTKPSGASAPDLEPTMTIHTKDALNAVNSMFQASFNVAEDNEDTVFVSGNSGQDDVGGFMVREDTVFLPTVKIKQKDIDDEIGGFSVREDTVFISNPGSVQVDDLDPNTGALSIREDTVFITGNAATNTSNTGVDLMDDTGAFSIHEDTMFISGNDSIATNAMNLPNLIIPSQEVNEAISNDENAAPEGLMEARPRRERAEFAVLSPLGLVTDGFKVEQDDEAEDILAHAVASCNNGATKEEGFAVFEDSNPDQQRINPFDSSFQRELVASLNPPVCKWPGVYELSDEEADACKKAFKAAKNAKSTKCTEIISTELVVRDVLSAAVTGKIGEGAYATVYGAICEGAEMALKVEHPPCPWEFLLCKIVEGRTAPRVCRTVSPTMMLLHGDFSVLVMPRGSGTLQELLNRYLAAKTQVDQCVTAAICLSLFRAMEQLHENKVVHNDIKPDNIIYDVSGDGEDASISVLLIDAGRGVDLELLPKHTVLFGDSETESFRCIEMRAREPWLWQADTYAVAGVIHCLILGDYMEVERATREDTGETFIRCRSKLPRSYNADVWEGVFKALLNVDSMSADCPPNWGELCQSMERVLDDCRASKVKSMRTLKKMISEFRFE